MSLGYQIHDVSKDFFKANCHYFMIYKFTVSVFESENDWNLSSDFQEQLATEINNEKQYSQKQ